MFFLHTQEAQRYLVFGARFACEDGGGPALEAIQKKFGPTEAAFGKRYFEEYKRKHGYADAIDKFLAKAVPYWESKEKAGGAKAEGLGAPKPPEEAAIVDALQKDEEIARNALYDATKDTAGFFAEVQEILEKGRKPEVIGDLEQVVIMDDTASGRAEITIGLAPTSEPAKSPPKVEKTCRTYKFRRVNGGWLLDSL